MEKHEYITLKKFRFPEEAEELKLLLDSHNVTAYLEDDSPSVDVTFSGNRLNDHTLVKIKKSDFEKANHILEEQAKEVANSISEDYYLFDFSNEELMEVLEKFDEWGGEDYLLAQKILRSRGNEIVEEQVEELRQRRIAYLRKPESGNTGWMVFGWIAAFLGGLLGVFIGWIHWTLKKTDPTGKQIPVYDSPTRKNGMRMFVTGMCCFIGWIIVVLLNK